MPPKKLLKELGMSSTNEVMLEVRKALYGLMQVVRHWSKLV